MADWYVSSVAYAAVSQFAASHAYSLGDIVRQRANGVTKTITSLTSVTTTATATVTAHGYITGQSVLISGAAQANYNKQAQVTVVDANTFTYAITATTSPATGSPVVTDSLTAGNERCWRCSTAGTSAASEPTWTLTKASTTTSSGATFTECSGNSSHQRDNGATTTWTAPLARAATAYNTFAGAADRIFASSDHTEAWTALLTIGNSAGVSQSIIRCFSVSRAGSVPPVPADLAPGAAITSSGSTANIAVQNGYWEGFTITTGSDGGNYSVTLNTGGPAGTTGDSYLKNCALNLLTTTTGSVLNPATNGVNRCVFDNTTVQFGAAAGTIGGAQSGVFEWKNTASAIQGATIPTTLFVPNTATGVIECRGVDFSALGSGHNLVNIGAAQPYEMRFSDCKIGASAALTTGSFAETTSKVDFINIDSGATGYKNQWMRFGGTVSPETTITRTGGATDGTQKVSHKFVSGTVVSKPFPLEGPALYAWNSTTGSSVTATIEIISSASLNNDDIWVDLEYLGSSSAPVSSVVSNAPATSLTTAGAQTSSSAAWDSSPATPAAQKLAVTFTPQLQGLVRAVVKLAKASTTVYVDPVLQGVT